MSIKVGLTLKSVGFSMIVIEADDRAVYASVLTLLKVIPSSNEIDIATTPRSKLSVFRSKSKSILL